MAIRTGPDGLGSWSISAQINRLNPLHCNNLGRNRCSGFLAVTGRKIRHLKRRSGDYRRRRKPSEKDGQELTGKRKQADEESSAADFFLLSFGFLFCLFVAIADHSVYRLEIISVSVSVFMGIDMTYRPSDSTGCVFGRLLKAIKAHSALDDSDIIQAGEHGADAGWNGFIYHDECAEFYNANESAIYELLNDSADSMGYKNIEELISGFNRSDMLDTPEGRKTLLAWFALEEVGRYLESV